MRQCTAPMVKAASVCAAAVILLCSCGKGQYLAVEFNRQSRVYSAGANTINDAYYSFDLYQNPNLPLKQYNGGIYFNFMSEYDASTPPLPAVIDPDTGDVRVFCNDEGCYHNKVRSSTRCILCDIYDRQRIAMRGGCLYYARADKKYYNEKTGEVEYKFDSPYIDETEFQYTLIEYHPDSGEFRECHTVEPGGYIDFITPNGDYIYFYETDYDKIENQAFEGAVFKKYEDGTIDGAYMFMDGEYGNKVLYDANLFYDKAILGEAPYHNIKVNRKMKVENNAPWVKVYRLKRLNSKNKKVDTLATRESLPYSFDIIDNRIYELRDEGYISYDMDYNTEYVSPEKPGPIVMVSPAQSASASPEKARSFQYDQFTKNIYYLKNGTLTKVKKAGESYRAVRSADLCPGQIVWYQLTFEGIYFMVGGDNGVYLAKYTDINSPKVPYEAVFKPDNSFTEKGGMILSPTVIGDYLYYAQAEDKIFDMGVLGSNSEMVITGLYRYSFESGKSAKIWPEGWVLR